MPTRDRITELRRVPAAELRANPRNWRRHPEHQARALRAILDGVGYAGALLARETPEGLELIDGHLRQELADDTPVPVLVLDVDQAEADLLLASFDPLGAMAVTDEQALWELLQSVEVPDRVLAEALEGLAGQAGPPAGFTDPDEVPDLPTEPTSQLGDVYELGEHRLACADATSPEVWARLMGGRRCALVFTDPPWNVDYRGGISKRQEALANDNVADGWVAWLASAIANIPCEENAPIYVPFGFMRAGDTEAALGLAGWRVMQTIIWVKQHAQFGNVHAHYKYQHEQIFYASAGAKQPPWYGPNNEVSVWHHDRASVNDLHPTQKPVELVVHALENSSERGALIVDAFLGSGATLIAAEETQRVCYGTEIDPAYCDVIVKRWEAYTGREAVLLDRVAETA